MKHHIFNIVFAVLFTVFIATGCTPELALQEENSLIGTWEVSRIEGDRYDHTQDQLLNSLFIFTKDGEFIATVKKPSGDRPEDKALKHSYYTENGELRMAADQKYVNYWFENDLLVMQEPDKSGTIFLKWVDIVSSNTIRQEREK